MQDVFQAIYIFTWPLAKDVNVSPEGLFLAGYFKPWGGGGLWNNLSITGSKELLAHFFVPKERAQTIWASKLGPKSDSCLFYLINVLLNNMNWILFGRMPFWMHQGCTRFL